MLLYFHSGDEELYATPDMQTYGRWRLTLFRMYGTALKLERGCRSSCSVLTPSPKKNIDSFRNGMGETNEVNDVEAGERGDQREERVSR